jgi:hypothetical protein
MIIKDFIPYETGIPTLAKEYGFNEPCLAKYCNWLSQKEKGSDLIGCNWDTLFYNTVDNLNGPISAPTYQQIQDWFILKGIEINTTSWKKGDQIVWYFSVNTLGKALLL